MTFTKWRAWFEYGIVPIGLELAAILVSDAVPVLAGALTYGAMGCAVVGIYLVTTNAGMSKVGKVIGWVVNSAYLIAMLLMLIRLFITAPD